MSNVNFSITGVSAGFTSWSGRFVVDSLDTAVESDGGIVEISINPATDNYRFTPTGDVYTYPDNNLQHDYSTWRSQAIATQFPETGKSIDLWSITLYNDITSGFSWKDLAITVDGNGNETPRSGYTLNADKHSLVYDYNNYYAPYYSRGGIITFSIVV